MSEITRDPILGGEVPLDHDEILLDEFTADPAAYWRGHAVLAALGGVAAGLVLVAIGNPDPWVGPLAAVLAIGARATYLKSEALSLRWRLTNRRLLGPGLRSIPRGNIVMARKFLGDVQVVTARGDKHLMKYMADAPAVIAAITAPVKKAGRA